MSFTGFAEDTDYLQTADDAFTAFEYPLTMVAWVKRSQAQWEASQFTGNVVSMGTAHSSNSPRFDMWSGNSGAYAMARTSVGSNKIGAYEAISTSPGWASIADKWVPICAVFASDTDRKIYVISSTYADADTVDAATIGTVIDTLRIGGANGTSGDYLTGYVAEVAIFGSDWSLDSASKVDELQTEAETGPAPDTIDSANCKAYWSLNADAAPFTDPYNSIVLSEAVGFTTLTHHSDHPTITSASTITDVNYHGTGRGIMRGVMRGAG